MQGTACTQGDISKSFPLWNVCKTYFQTGTQDLAFTEMKLISTQWNKRALS